MSKDKDPLLDNDLDDLLDEPEADVVNPEVDEQQDELQEVLDAVADADPLPEEIVDEVEEDEAVLEDRAISGNVPPSDWAEPDKEEVLPVTEEVSDEQEAKDLVTALSSAEPTHLEVLNTYGEVSVEEFRRYANLGNEARFVLDTYIGQGLVVRNWKRSKGRYSLTEAGKAAVNS